TSVDLNGWTIKDEGDNSHVIAGTAIVPAGGYSVLCRNDSTMVLEGVNAIYEYGDDIVLGNGADEVILINTSAAMIDSVAYDGGTIWPDPTGASMMWNEASGDNNNGLNWATSTTPFGSGDFGTPEATNGTVVGQAPVIKDVYHRALMPGPGEAVTVYGTITDNDGTITSASVFYQVNGGGFSSVAMGHTGDLYSGAIPAGSLGDAVDYYVSATDNDFLTTTLPFDAPTGFFSYTVANEVITPIATIQADPASYEGTLVKVQGQVYIPGDYKADGISVSAYIQDGAGSGINIFGTYRSTGMDLLNDTSAIVTVTGYVDMYYTTVEVVNYEVELVSTGNTELTPLTVTTGAAGAATYEGTYIHSQGPITAIFNTSGSNPSTNFTVNDGSGDLVIRIDDSTVDMSTWIVGDVLEGAGAGSEYNTQGQILIGLASKVTNHGQGADTTPPLLTGATLTAATTVTLNFNELLDATTATTAANYQVYQTGNPGAAITVTGATQPSGAVVVLTLAASASGTAHTVEVDNVEDVAGNPIAAGTTMGIFEAGTTADIVINEVMQNPYVLSDSDGEWFEVYNAGTSDVDMNGWYLMDADYDTTLIDNGGPLIIHAGEYKVLGRNATAMAGEGVTLFYQYSGFTLGNSADELYLANAGMEIVDSIVWDGGVVWPDPTGYSMQWTGVGDNNDGATWVDMGAPAFGSGDRGTPGSANDWVSPVPSAGLKTALDPNYPNPFNPRTSFSFSLDKNERVTLAVYDVRGSRVRTIVDSVMPAGRYDQQFSWDGVDDRGATVNSGMYFYRLTTESGFSQTGKMTLLK
ncbi:MAG: lamin tail domain-containing protein, partial [Candidatus Krumholzibacteria bacterium]|nr:lamin tail domain-containing protein [Candidatus Krumholzibacteria bacterium]